jgi:hypothetical protein
VADEMIGKRFGKLVVVERSGSTKNREKAYLCKCDCGKSTIADGPGMREGQRKSCGCVKNGRIKHGLTHLPEHATWCRIRQRCNNPNDHKFKDYGGRGIKVCDRWSDFANFYEDMGSKPSKQHSIDRINVNGDYEQNNCRWATPKEQAQNTRANVSLTYKGETKCLSEWCAIKGISFIMLRHRIKHKWPEELLFSPIKYNSRSIKAEALASLEASKASMEQS